MFSSRIRYSLYGVILTASLGSLAVQAAGTDGIFGDYFQNMIRDAASCGTNTVITGFDTTAGSTFGTQECTPFNTLVKTVLKTFWSAPAWQAVVGYDPATGNPIFWDVNWVRSGANISYTPGRVGIGTASPSQALDVAGNARVSGNVGIGTSSPATTLQVNGNIQAAGSPVPSNWYNLQAGSIGASTVYGYNSICTGNSSGVCNGVWWVVLSNAWSIGIGWPTQSTNWWITVLKDSWAMVARPSSGWDNSQPQNPVGSIYANDVYLRSTGQWMSQAGAIQTTVVTAAASSCTAYGCSSYVACPAGYRVTGGGHSFYANQGCNEKFRFVTASIPSGEWWYISMSCAAAYVYAVCAR